MTSRVNKPSPMVRIAPDLYEAVSDLAKIHGVSIQAAVEFAVEAWLQVARQAATGAQHLEHSSARSRGT